MNEPLVFSEDDITIGDLEDFEEITGSSLVEFVDSLKSNDGTVTMDAKMVKFLKAVVYIIKRRENPSFTVEDARNVKVNELVLAPSGVDPTAAASSDSGRPSATSGA